MYFCTIDWISLSNKCWIFCRINSMLFCAISNSLWCIELRPLYRRRSSFSTTSLNSLFVSFWRKNKISLFFARLFYGLIKCTHFSVCSIRCNVLIQRNGICNHLPWTARIFRWWYMLQGKAFNRLARIQYHLLN